VDGVGVGVAGVQHLALQGVGEGGEGVVFREVAGREGVQRMVHGVGDGAGRGAAQGAQEDLVGGGIARGSVWVAWSADGWAQRVCGGAVGGGHPRGGGHPLRCVYIQVVREFGTRRSRRIH
jgi:hypothetical protein